MKDLLQLPAILSIQERVDNLESKIYSKASELFGFVPPPKRCLRGKNRRARLYQFSDKEKFIEKRNRL